MYNFTLSMIMIIAPIGTLKNNRSSKKFPLLSFSVVLILGNQMNKEE